MGHRYRGRDQGTDLRLELEVVVDVTCILCSTTIYIYNIIYLRLELEVVVDVEEDARREQHEGESRVDLRLGDRAVHVAVDVREVRRHLQQTVTDSNRQ